MAGFPAIGTGAPTSAAPVRLTRGRSGPLADALVLIAVAGLLAFALEIAMILEQGYDRPLLTILQPLAGLVYLAAGVFAWWRRPSSRLGLLIVIGGGTLLLGALYQLPTTVPVAVGDVTQTLILALILHLLVAFPTGRLRTTAERVVVVTGYLICTVLQAPLYLFTPGRPLSAGDRPDLVHDAVQAQRITGALVVVAAAALLAGRARRATPQQRRVLVPLSVYGIVALLYAPLTGLLFPAATAHAWFPAVQCILLAGVPVVFVAAATRGGFARTGDIAELGTWLAADEAARPPLRDALAATLGDPTLQLLFRLPAQDGLVDARGIAVHNGTAPEPTRGTVDVELGGQAVGAIVYDAMLLDRPEEIREAGRVVALAVDRQRLTVELRASRARLAAAADDERRRIARDLHDGLQSRLVFLAVQAATETDPGALSEGLQSAIHELRELVDGVMPARLTERGLAAAVEGLREQVPVPIGLHVAGLDGERLRPDVETAAYFVVSEAIVNAVKHSGSQTVDVALERAGAVLTVAVTDGGGAGADGAGGSGGHGLRNMADRVQALGGELFVEPAAGGGTRVRAVIPCGS